MKNRLMKALTKTKRPISSIDFSELPVGAPFRWVEEGEFARNGVCIKVSVAADGKLKFKSLGLDSYGWMPLENEKVGTIYANGGCAHTRVIPL